MASYREPRDAAPVYRCDDHWHFRPHKHDYHPTRKPWYREEEHSAEGAFELYAYPVYAQGHGDEQFVVSEKYVSGFYELRKPDRDSRWSPFCPGLDGGDNEKLWRVEEISRTPWGRAQAVDSQVVHDEAANDDSLPSYETPYQPPPSYRFWEPNETSQYASPSHHALDWALHRATPSLRALYHAPPSNQPRPSPYSGRHRYENNR